MDGFLRKNEFTGERDTFITSSNKEEIRALTNTYFGSLSYENTERLKTDFKHFDAVDLAEIEFFNNILESMGKVLVITSSEGLKEYVDWYSKRSHIKLDRNVYFVGGPMETNNQVVIADLNQMIFVEQILTQLAPYDILVQDLDKATPSLLKANGSAIFKCGKYDLVQATKIASFFDQTQIINSATNTAHIYMICVGKGKVRSDVDIKFILNKAYIDAYVASKTGLINTKEIALTFDRDKIAELWQIPKLHVITFTKDPEYQPSRFASVAPRARFSLHKAPRQVKLIERNINQKPEYRNGLIVFDGVGEIQEDKLFQIPLTTKERQQLKSFTKKECIEIMLKSDTFLSRIYSTLVSLAYVIK